MAGWAAGEADNGVLWVGGMRVFGRRKKEEFLNLDY